MTFQMGWLQLDRAKQTSKYDLIHEVMYNPFLLSCYLCFASSKRPDYIIKYPTFFFLGVGLSKM